MYITGTYIDSEGQLEYLPQDIQEGWPIEGLAVSIWIGNEPQPSKNLLGVSRPLRVGEYQTITPDSSGYLVENVYFRLTRKGHVVIQWASAAFYTTLRPRPRSPYEAYLVTDSPVS